MFFNSEARIYKIELAITLAILGSYNFSFSFVEYSHQNSEGLSVSGMHSADGQIGFDVKLL